MLWAALGVGSAVATRLISNQQRAMNLQGRTVLLTGGSRGLGLELGRVLIEEGVQLAICARSEEDLEEARRMLDQLAKEKGQIASVLAISCDVSQREQVQAMVRQVEEQFGPVEILINNAGTIQVAPLEEMEEREFKESINTHYWGPFYTMDAVLPRMRQRQQGRIVNIASIGGKVSIPHLVPYSAGKHALVGLSEGYRAELLKDHIYVTTVCPGLIRTGSPRNAVFKGKHREEHTWFTLSASSPLVSMDARQVAQDIIEACRYGRSTLVLSVQAKTLTGLNGLFPGLVSDMLGLANQWLPEPGGIGKQRRKGYESQSDLAPSNWTEANQEAAQRNNGI